MNPLTAGLAVVVVVYGRPGRKCPQARMFKQAAEFCARDGRTKEPVNSTGRDYQPAMYATAKAQTCDRCSKVQMHNEAHAPAWRGRTLRQVLAKLRHDGCGGRPGRAGGAAHWHRGRVQPPSAQDCGAGWLSAGGRTE